MLATSSIAQNKEDADWHVVENKYIISDFVPAYRFNTWMPEEKDRKGEIFLVIYSGVVKINFNDIKELLVMSEKYGFVITNNISKSKRRFHYKEIKYYPSVTTDGFEFNKNDSMDIIKMLSKKRSLIFRVVEKNDGFFMFGLH